MKLTIEISVDNLNDINYLMLSNPKQFVSMIIKPIILMESRVSKLPMIWIWLLINTLQRKK
jgi:hypothetical protein